MSVLDPGSGGNKSLAVVRGIAARPFPLYVSAVLLLAACLAIRGLGSAYFWGDESCTAVAARNFLAAGRLTGWDGRNLLAFGDGAILDDQMRYREPPLPALAAAAGFRLFGATTRAGRIPFVAAGLAALLIFALLLREELGARAPGACYALAALAFSPVFLLFIRQCRYYALTMVFALLLFQAWRRALEMCGTTALGCGDKCGAAALLRLAPLVGAEGRGASKRATTPAAFPFLFGAAAAVGLFYSNWLLCAAFLGALAATHLAFFRNRFAATQWKSAACCLGAFLLATVPYALSRRIWDRPEFVVDRPWYVNKPILLWWFVRDLSTMGCVPWMLAAIVVGCLMRRRLGNWEIGRSGRKRTGAGNVPISPSPDQAGSAAALTRTLALWCFFGSAYVVFIVLLCPQTTARTFFADVRYLAPVIPFFIGAVGMGLAVIHSFGGRGRLAAVALLCATLACNLLCLTPAYPQFRWLLPAYLNEIHNPYPTANEAVAKFLLANAKQDDLVLAAPDYCNYPILFYAGDKVKLCCALTEHSRIRAAAEQLDAPLLKDRFFPDWIIVFDHPSEWPELLNQFARPIPVGNLTLQYRYRAMPLGQEVYWGETNRPELFCHSFGPLRVFDPAADGVSVYHKTEAVISGRKE